MQQCIHCKADLPADAQFCDRCGTSVKEEQQQLTEPASTTIDDAADTEDTSKLQAVSSSSPALRTIRTRRMHSQQSIPDFPQGNLFPVELPEEPVLENVENLDFAPTTGPGEQANLDEQETATVVFEQASSETPQTADSTMNISEEEPATRIEDLPTQIVPSTPVGAVELSEPLAQPAQTPATAETPDEQPEVPAQPVEPAASAEAPAEVPVTPPRSEEVSVASDAPAEETMILAQPVETPTASDAPAEIPAQPAESAAYATPAGPEKPAEPPPLLSTWPGEAEAIPATPAFGIDQHDAAASVPTSPAAPATPTTLGEGPSSLPEPQPTRRRGRGKLVAAIIIVVLVVLAGGVGAFALVSQRGTPGTAAQCASQQTGCANGSPATGHAGASHLVFANAVSGPLEVNGQSHCQVVTLANTRALTVTLSGTINGKFYNFGFTIERYQGAKTYDSSATSMTVLLDVPGESTTNGWGNNASADAGTVTVAGGEQTGSISFLLSGFGTQAGSQVQVSGDWACS